MAIDSVTDKIREIIGEEDDELLGALTQVGGVFQPVVAVAATVKAVVDKADRHHRVCLSIRALCNELDAIREQLPQDATDVLKQPWFRRAMRVMMEEAARSEDESKARQLGVAVAQGCFPADDNGHRQEDLASYIHDLARLGTDDVQMLNLLRDVYREPIRTTPNMHDPNYFTQHFSEFKKMASELKIHPDDCVAIGARLSGFGLAYEVMFNSSRQSPGEHCFRPTRRGVYLLSLLEASETPKAEQN